MAAKFNDGDKNKPVGLYHNYGNTRKEGQYLQDQSGSLSLTHSPKGRVEQVAMTPEISNKHVTRPTIPNYLEIDNKTITGTSTIIYQKQDNEIDKPEDKLDKILRRQGRDIKNAVQDEKKRSENFGKELKEVTQKIDNNKTAIEDIQTRVDVMSNDNEKLSDLIIKSLDDVKNNQEASRKLFKEQLAAMETRQIEHISEIHKTQLQMQEMIRIIQAMRNARK
ncbi:unnamed protein product [Mytilus edulis]|uniref:Uncharacterized protein n=1 Tax=Mytilus edulis TaxID=6550 RepID=A0A8S3TSM9_MYTED|nr:unnamed protein product [Mytilus edulis]